jgi:hypothetical protein
MRTSRSRISLTLGATVTLALLASPPLSTAAMAADPTVNCRPVPSTENSAVVRQVYTQAVNDGADARVMLATFETAWVESHFNNCSNGDLDSVGVFQQRANWGSVDARETVATAAHAFLIRAKNVDATAGATVTAGQIAQKVQASANPSAYDQSAAKANALIATYSTAFVTMARTPSGNGYYLLTRDGGVRPHGTAPTFGDARGQSYFTGQTAIALVVTTSGNGYWILSEAGGVYGYGDAQSYGAAAGQSYFTGQRAVALVPNAAGNGYWILSAAGGVYSYGGAAFFGAAAGQSYFNGQSAVGLTRSPGGNGYWILAASGGIYSYGDAPFFGSAGGQSYFAGQRAVALTTTASGHGYWVASASGGVYSYGDAGFFGSAAGQSYFNNQTATGLIRSARGSGYWIPAASGGVYAYGDAPFLGAA